MHTNYGVSLGTALLGGITQQDVRTGTQVRGEATSGEVYPRFQSIVEQKPGASWSTLAIKAALDAVGFAGASIANLTGGLKMYAQKGLDGSTRSAGSDHTRWTFTKGLVANRRLSADRRGDAVLSQDALATWDGSNNPLVQDTASLPTGLTDAERFALGPITVGGVALTTGAQKLDLEFGLSIALEGRGSEIWDRAVYVREIMAVLTISGIDPGWMTAAGIPLGGKEGTHLNTSIYLRKRASGASFVADGTAEHIKLTAAGLAYIDPPFSGGETTLVMPLKFDGTNAPLVINTASAIS